MQYTRLGKTGVRVSRLCFGTMSFGGDADDQTSATMFARCREAGINFFDCANIYSFGLAEEILGRLMKGSRDELVITSKVGFTMDDGRVGPGLARRTIMMSVEDSLRRLGTDRLDVLFCHHSDPETPVEETLRALEDLIRQGKVLYAGVSNWTAGQIARALGRAEMLGLSGLHVVQPMYNLAKRTAEIEILPLAASEDLGVITYSPLGGGLLTGKYSRTAKDAAGRLATNQRYAVRYADEEHYALAERFTEYSREVGVSPVTLAVAWVKANPAVTAPIIGARNLEQLEPSLAAADYEMPKEQWEAICALTPPVPLPTDRDEERA
jgi:aryl-alcohol dehydrogenase-like predicted oxidoreductase